MLSAASWVMNPLACNETCLRGTFQLLLPTGSWCLTAGDRRDVISDNKTGLGLEGEARMVPGMSRVT